jgi:short-subunit dehydrogenase
VSLVRIRFYSFRDHTNVSRLDQTDQSASFLIARTESKLEALQNELIDQLVNTHQVLRSEAESRVLFRAADISSAQDLIEVREEVIKGKSTKFLCL